MAGVLDGMRAWWRRPEPVQVVVDRAARREMAGLVRGLASRRLTNFQFEERAEALAERAAADPALWEVCLFCWSWYDDFREHRLAALAPAQRRAWARVVLFLRSDEPYCWIRPRRPLRAGSAWDWALDGVLHLVVGAWVPMVSVARLVLWAVLWRVPERVAPKGPAWGERKAVWPFADAAGLAEARAKCRLLGAGLSA